ncbi:hypothetical protein [Sulfitobacter sp.]|jgi:hypothetical protein|uniref:hypothetical protein n=1 Tax=Sulfitobacter sp. TaxID=1903071 RepID=UPI00356429B1|tara:strand:+ start:3265 stop:3438 length:174 start_codon:yes stop_codon:yes gene_type:complete
MLETLRKIRAIYREETSLDWIVWGANMTGAVIVVLAFLAAQNPESTSLAIQLASSDF